ncbi:MAG: hypothetical protein WCG86_07040 [Actinomycetota bacterium]|jgi:hypothetical protein
MTYEFLSPEWLVAATEIRNAAGDLGDAPVEVIMNLTVTDVPFGPDTLEAHLNSASGPLAIEYEHHANAHLSITIDWSTAKALLIDGNPQAAMGAFLNGKIKVEGDMSKLIALQNTPPSPRAQVLLLELRALTA